MKNIIIATGLILMSLLLSTQINAQNYPDIEFKKGDIELSVGVGLMNTFIDKNTTAPMPPVSLHLGYRIKKTISIGTYLGYSRTKYDPPIKDIDLPNLPSLTNNYFQAGLRGNAHFTEGRVDFYGGAMIGYNFSINDFDNLEAGRLEGVRADAYSDIVVFSGHIGMKYLITEHVGIYGEVGYGVSVFNFGVTTRF